MSKLNSEQLKQAIADILAAAEKKKRNFDETIELQIGLKDYDTQRDKRFAGSVRLPHIPRPRLRVCVLGDAQHCEEAKKLGVPCMDVEELKKLQKNKKLVKRLAQQYHCFLSSQAVITQLPKILGPGLNKAGKFPTLVTHNDKLEEKILDLKCQCKFQLKKVLCMSVAVGNIGMSDEHCRQNIVTSINFLTSLLKKQWHNIKSLVIKSTMGPAQRVYG